MLRIFNQKANLALIITLNAAGFTILRINRHRFQWLLYRDEGQLRLLKLPVNSADIVRVMKQLSLNRFRYYQAGNQLKAFHFHFALGEQCDGRSGRSQR